LAASATAGRLVCDFCLDLFINSRGIDIDLYTEIFESWNLSFITGMPFVSVCIKQRANIQ